MRNSLEDKLRRLGGDVQCIDASTIVCQRVPVNPSFFSRPEANVLVKLPRRGRGGPVQVYIDDDLKYTGNNAAVAGVFENNARQSGWRLILIRQDCAVVEPLIDDVLAALGLSGDPAVPSVNEAATSDGESHGLLESIGRTIDVPEELTGREEEIIEAVSCLAAWKPARIPVIVGNSGAGKSVVAAAAARRFCEMRPGCSVSFVDVGHLFAGALFPADRENALASIIEEAAGSQKILALERIELIAQETAYGVHTLAHALGSGVKVLGTCRPGRWGGLAALMDGCVRPIELLEFSETDTETLLGAVAADIQKHHRVEIDNSLAKTCVQLARHLPGCLPAKAIGLLDFAAARASVVGTGVVGQDDLYAAARKLQEKG